MGKQAVCLPGKERARGLENDAGGGCTEGQQTQKCYMSRKQNVQQKKVCKVECGKLFITCFVWPTGAVQPPGTGAESSS